ncbi:MAG TPA: putative porin [Terriglobales bacterium]
MKSVLRWGGVFLLSAGALMAQTATTKTLKKKTVSHAAATTVTADDVQQLRDALAAQQRQIEQLRQEMRSRDAALQESQQQAQSAAQQLQQAQSAATDAQQKAAAASAAASGQQDQVAQLSSDMKDVKSTLTNDAVQTQEDQKRMGAIEGLVGRFRFNGDVRVRGENFDQSGTQDRNRGRIRVRFGFDGKLNEDFLAGISLATGALGDPTSTNESLTNVFDRKTIGLDRGWISYNPIAHKWLTMTGGKFLYTWQRTPATFDSDLNPEGFTEKASFDMHHGVIRNTSVQAMELLYNEVSGGQDSYALGAQGSLKLQFGRWTATPSITSLKWNRPDAILSQSAFAVGATTAGFTNPATGTVTGIQVPGEGPGCAGGTGFQAFGPCVFAPNGMTNATFVDAAGKAHFYSGYNYIDIIDNNQIATGNARLPINLMLEFLDNVDAETHPLGAGGVVRTDLGSQNKEYGFDFNIGQTKNKNDFQVGYAWNRQEQDSAIASFAESDQRAPTNILENRIYALWKVRANTVGSFTWWHGRTLNTSLQNAVRAAGVGVGATEPDLNRLQFDLIYTF